MEREEIRNKIFEYFKSKIVLINSNPHQLQQLTVEQIYALFPRPDSEPQWKHEKVYSIAREIIQELENCGFIYEGKAGGYGGESSYPFFSITEYGMEAFISENWLPYDSDEYIKVLKIKVPDIDNVTLAYIGESVSAYNRRQLLSATITLGVASENLMLLLVEAYADWIKEEARKARFQKKTKGKFISIQYKEFKKEFVTDIKLLPMEFQSDWETYLEEIFNFIRLNRNDAGHPTGKKLDAKIVFANLQIFSEYAQYIFNLIKGLS